MFMRDNEVKIMHLEKLLHSIELSLKIILSLFKFQSLHLSNWKIITFSEAFCRNKMVSCMHIAPIAEHHKTLLNTQVSYSFQPHFISMGTHYFLPKGYKQKWHCYLETKQFPFYFIWLLFVMSFCPLKPIGIVMKKQYWTLKFK
jgi:hypothetical protein